MTSGRDPRPARRRAALLAVTEPVRTMASAGALAASLPLLRAAPRGEPHPVLVLPGLMASDLSTKALRGWIGRLGYPVVGWALGRNRGPTKEVNAELPALIARLATEHGSPVSNTSATNPVSVWVDGQLYGGAEMLKSLGSDVVESARYYTATEAQNKYGMRASSPIIDLVTRRPGS